MPRLVKLCARTAVEEGAPIRVVVEGFPPLAVYCLAEEIFITADTCTHGMASLCDGVQEGEEIECPYHGGAFNIKTGEAIAFPCVDPIQVFEPVIDGDHICVEAPGN